MSRQPPTQELVAKDLHGNEWRFRHIFRGNTLVFDISFPLLIVMHIDINISFPFYTSEIQGGDLMNFCN